MPGIGWECKCGKVIEQGQGFDWTFKCANLNCGKIHCYTCGGDNIGKDGACENCSTSTRRIFSTDMHSKECGQKDWEAKKAKLREIVAKHIEVCNQALRCAKCSKPFNYEEKYTKIKEGSKRAGDYHPSCWAEIEKEGNDNDDSQRERERERERESKIALIV